MRTVRFREEKGGADAESIVWSWEVSKVDEVPSVLAPGPRPRRGEDHEREARPSVQRGSPDAGETDLLRAAGCGV